MVSRMRFIVTFIHTFTLLYILTCTYVKGALLAVLFVIKVECTVLMYHKIHCV
jgi:hypothetical protein